MINLMEEFERSGGFTHAFLATYEFTPGFFEDRLLRGRALARCPNIVVFVDPGVYASLCENPLGGKSINRRYIVTPAGPRHLGAGVFHPKVWLLAGEKNARLYVGSANLTRSGLTRNVELVSVFDLEIGQAEQGASQLRSALAFFELLASHPDTANPAVTTCLKAVRRTCPFLVEEAGPQNDIALVHNLERPLLDQLLAAADGSWRTVRILGPFFDSHIGELLNALLLGTQVGRAEIVTQQGTNTMNVAALAKWREKHPDTELEISVVQAPGRTLHAKAVSVSDERGRRFLTLIGSANFTKAALLSAASDEGNVETCLLLGGKAAAATDKALRKGPLAKTVAIGLDELKARRGPGVFPPAVDGGRMRLLHAEVNADGTEIEAAFRLADQAEEDARRLQLCVQRCDSTYPDFTCDPVGAAEDGQVAFLLSPAHASVLSSAAKAWLRSTEGAGDLKHAYESNQVWLLNLMELRESREKLDKKAARQFRESGAGLVAFMDEQLAGGMFDRAIDLLDSLTIRFQDAAFRARRGHIWLGNPRSPIRDDEEPVFTRWLRMDQRKRLGIAVRDFVERHHDKVLRKHLRRPNPNGTENFLDVLETCTDLSVKALVGDLLDRETVIGMVRAGLRIFGGGAIEDSYFRVLRGEMWGQETQLREVLVASRVAERVAAVGLAVVCADPKWRRRGQPRSLNLAKLVAAMECPQIGPFFEFVGEPSPGLAGRVSKCVAGYCEPRHFFIELVD